MILMKPGAAAIAFCFAALLAALLSCDADAAIRKTMATLHPQGPWHGGQFQSWQQQHSNDVKIEFRSPFGHEFSFEQQFEFGAGGSTASIGGAAPSSPALSCSAGRCAQHMPLWRRSSFCGSRGQWQYFDDQGSAGSCPGARKGPISGKWLRCC